MANRIRNLFESIVFAGMKPENRSTSAAPAGKLGLLARFLNGSAQSDPLYLTNQTFGQKAKRILLVSAPVVVVIAGIFLTVQFFRPKNDKAPKAMTAAEIREKVLPGFNQEFKLDSNRDLEITEVHFESGVMVGSLRNRTDRAIIQAKVVFDLADSAHSVLGAVTLTESNLAAGASREFRMPTEQSSARYAQVREMETK